MSDLESIGYIDWFKSLADNKKSANHAVARIVSVHKDSYIVTKGGEEIFAELSGNILYSSESASDLPTTGDWVYSDFYDNDTHVYNNTNLDAWTKAHNMLINNKGTSITKEDLIMEGAVLSLRDKAKVSAFHKNKIANRLKEVCIVQKSLYDHTIIPNF